MNNRSVFIVSDGTGITAEVLGHSLLSQFSEVTFHITTLPFVNSDDKVVHAVRQINEAAATDETKPLVFSTFVKVEYTNYLRTSNSIVMDIFGTFLDTIASELDSNPSRHVGYGHGVVDTDRYTSRIRAVHYSMDCDDGLSVEAYRRADLILVGVSRIGKTPVCLYLAMHFGLFCANFPLTVENFASEQLPTSLQPYRNKIVGLTIDHQRLHEIRQERRPGSHYAELQQCRDEVRQAESLFRQHVIPFVNTTGVSIEEIATSILQLTGVRRELAG